MQQPTPTPSAPPASQSGQTAHDELLYPPPPENRASPPFSVLAALFNKLSDERKHERRRTLLSVWLDHWRKDIGFNLYPVLRLLLPQKDRERLIYGLKEKNIAKAYIKIIPLGTKDPDAVRLLNWKKPTDRNKSSGDFPAVLHEVIQSRSSVDECKMTIDQLNEALDNISRRSGNSDAQCKILSEIYSLTTAVEQRWIARIVLKDMNISVKETTVFSVFHPDAQDLFNTCSDLKRVAWELWNPEYRAGEGDKVVQLFRAFAPMLCKRPTRNIEESVKEMGGRPFIIEEKLDGERMQLHKRGNEYFYCSRKGKDYTYLYGKHIGEGSLTPFIAECFDSRVDEIILDGEMLVWDPVSERNLPFGTLKTAALDKSKGELNPRPCFKIFDILYLNGMSIINKSVKFRKRNLRACISEVKGRIEFVVESEGKTSKDVRNKMEEIMENRGEGLVLKRPEAEYVLNGRNKDWIKVKPEYMDNMGETLDILVVAGSYGSGRRGGGVSSLICAVLDDQVKSEDGEPTFSTFVRVGSGITYGDYVWIRSRPWKKRDPKNPPTFIQTTSIRKGIEDKGDMYLEPADSFIVTVKAAEITQSDQYHAGFTLRFPRVLRIREELQASDCLTVKALAGSVRSEKKRKTENDSGKPKKKRNIAKTKPVILSEFRNTNLKNVQVTSAIFEGMTFTVVPDPKSRNRDSEKEDMLKLIKANGGTIVQVAKNQPGLMIVYGGETKPYNIQMIMTKGVHDIVRPSWIIDCVQRGKRLPLAERYFFYVTAERRKSEEFDRSEVLASDGSVTESDGEDIQHGEVAKEDKMTASLRDRTPPPVKPEPQLSPTLREWFHVDDDPVPQAPQDDDSETDPESEVNVGDDGDDDDDWFSVKHHEEESQDNKSADDDFEMVDSNTVDDAEGSADVKMGEDTDAMTYDEERIFTHLRFYIDSPSNARRNGMEVHAKAEDAIEKNFARISSLITENGGRLGDLDDAKLTHVVLDKRDDSRRRELMQRTSKPVRKYLVLTQFIEACLEENTLLDESEFVP